MDFCVRVGTHSSSCNHYENHYCGFTQGWDYLQRAGRSHHLFAAAGGGEWRHGVLSVWRLQTLLWQNTGGRDCTSEEENPPVSDSNGQNRRRHTAPAYVLLTSHTHTDSHTHRPLITGREKGATWPSRSRSKMWCMKATWLSSASGTSLSVSLCSRLLWKRPSRSSLGGQGELWICSSFSTATG